jgi:GntR family transcriptional regulator
VVAPEVFRLNLTGTGAAMINDIVDKSSIIPIYYQLCKYYEKQITDGVLKPGDALPTEMEIAENLSISRMTVRRAIAELAAAGMIYTQKGKGTFVAKPELDNVVFDLGNYFNEIKQKGLNLYTKLLEAKIVKADKLTAKRMNVEINTRCLFFRMVVIADNEPLAYEAKYTVYSKRKPTLESELRDPSLSSLVTVHSDSVPASSKKILLASKAMNEEPGILGIAPGSPVFVMVQTIYDADNKIIAWGKSIFRGDRYKLVSYDGWNIEGIKNEGQAGI